MSYFNIIGQDCEDIIMEYKRQLEINHELNDEIKNHKTTEYSYDSWGRHPNILTKKINGSPYVLIYENNKIGSHKNTHTYTYDARGNYIQDN